MPSHLPQLIVTKMTQLPDSFIKIREKYPAIYIIVSPPRCGSTAFARVFWEHPTVRYYSHEPFEVTYSRQQDLSEVAAKLDQPLIDLHQVDPDDKNNQGKSLVIKEMPYQVGKNFPIFLG